MWLPLIVAICSQLALAGGQTSPAATGRVRGQVIKAESGAPLPGARVRLSAPQGQARETTSDAAGRFEFTGIAPGAYVMSVAKGSYIRLVKDVTLAGALEDVVLRVTRGGAISGRILDDTGEPVVEAAVQALRAEYVTGGRRLKSQHQATTNDLGEYRLYGLPTGTYYVVAATAGRDPEGYSPDPSVNVAPGAAGFAPTFFPGSPVAADAQSLRVRAGAETAGIDFVLRAVRLARLSGTVVNSRGRPATDVIVMLNMFRAGGTVLTPNIGDMAAVEPAADGSFVLSNVGPGDYRLDVYAKGVMEAIAKTGGLGRAQSDSMAEYASVPVSVNGEDQEGIRIATIPGRRLSGRISVDGGPLSPEALTRLRVWTVDRGAGLSVSALMSGASAVIQPDGFFEVRGAGGVRLFAVSGLPSGWAVNSVRAGGMDVTDTGVEIRESDVSDIEIRLTVKPAGISGLAVDTSNRPLAGAHVIVFPEDRSRWASPPNRHLTSAKTGPAGTFEVSPLPAGDYLVAIVEELVDGEWGEADTLERLRASAVAVRVADGQSAPVTLRSR